MTNLVLKDDAGGREVEVDDTSAVDEAEAGHDLPHEELALLLRQLVVGGGQSLKQRTTLKYIS